jgi:PA14 domain
MPWTLRQPKDETNPTLPGGIYGEFITAGRLVYWFFDGTNTRVILFISDGGRYGLDAIHEVGYDGEVIPEFESSVRKWKFHRGTLTKQIEPKAVTAVNISTDFFNCSTQNFANGDQIRFHARDGSYPAGVSANTKYFVMNRTSFDFQISETAGGSAIDLTALGTGFLTVWKADAGFDDAGQGLPELLTNIKNTFSGIAYLQIILPSAYSSADGPDEGKFRIYGRGRRLMNYDEFGNELGIVTGAGNLYNPALQAIDGLIVEYKKPISRIDWASFKAFKDDCNVMIWQRAVTDTGLPGTGLIGRYYNTKVYPESSGSPLADFNDDETVLKMTRLDAVINFDWGNDPPATGLNANWFAVVWEGRVKFEFSETYTFKSTHDNGVRLWIDGQQIINFWEHSTGTHTGQFTATAGQLATIRFEFAESWGAAAVDLKWSSASVAEELIPAAKLYASDSQVRRYESHMAFPEPTEASIVFSNIMDRCPGWHWTDQNGKIKFLPPTRPTVFEFVVDPNDDDVLTSLLDSKSFEKRRKNRRDRKNFRIFLYRNFAATSFPNAYTQGNRPRLRETSDISPDNDSATQLGVMSQSQADRIAEYTMVIQTDSRHSFPFSADRSAGVVGKMEKVLLKFYLKNNIEIANVRALATSVYRQGTTVEFTLMPISEPFYTDEVVV